MDYEKAYKAALATAKQWIKDGCEPSTKVCLECTFPELRESEDERMRKAILAALRQGLDTEAALQNYGFAYDDVEAWLKSLLWKPSKTQMEALQRALDACECEWAYEDKDLRSLVVDLKKWAGYENGKG